MTAPPLTLASASPRRAHLLSMLGLSFDIEASRVTEEGLPGETPRARVERLAREKASDVHARRPGSLVIAGDTLVILDGEALGKPCAPGDARRMLERLSGRAHEVATALALATPGGVVHSGTTRTRVAFRELEPDEIAAYVATGEPMDKAGAYGIQEFGASLVTGVEGDYFAVVGLPVPLLLRLLEAAGWRYLFGHLKPVRSSERRR